MYDIKKVAECLTGRIGFSPVTDTELSIIDTDLTESKSGLYWDQNAHALVTVENLQAIGDDEDASNFPAYDALKSYVVGATVKEAGVLYRAIQATTPGIPVSNPAYWAETSAFSVWVRKKIQASIKSVAAAMLKQKKLNKSVKSLLEDAQLYTGAGNKNDKEVAQGRFVGLQFSFKNFQNLSAIINRIGTQFSDVFTDPLKIYLYHTSEAEPIQIFELTPDKAYTVQWSDMEALTMLATGSADIGGVYFLGYYEDDLPLGMQAINRTNYSFKTGSCSSCSGIADDFKKWYKYLSVLPIAIPGSALESDKSIFDWEAANYYDSEKTFGLNLHMSIGCDISRLICRQQHLFDQALIMQFAVDMLREIAYSTRTNRIQERVKQSAMFELDNRGESANSPQKGLVSQLSDTIDALDFDLSDIDGVCLACNKSSGINYTSI